VENEVSHSTVTNANQFSEWQYDAVEDSGLPVLIVLAGKRRYARSRRSSGSVKL
jgi:hypothetical protein